MIITDSRKIQRNLCLDDGIFNTIAFQMMEVENIEPSFDLVYFHPSRNETSLQQSRILLFGVLKSQAFLD